MDGTDVALVCAPQVVDDDDAIVSAVAVLGRVVPRSLVDALLTLLNAVEFTTALFGLTLGG